MNKTKTHTKPILFSGQMVRAILEGHKTQTRRVIKPQPQEPTASFPLCPYGQPGCLLWIRETWAHIQGKIIYRCNAAPEKHKGPWLPSIFMPRRASRITLRITDVRPEKLQQISEQDAQSEGCFGYLCHENPALGLVSDGELPTEEYQRLWDSLNAKRGFAWDTNPWVWVICFEKAEVTT